MLFVATCCPVCCGLQRGNSSVAQTRYPRISCAAPLWVCLDYVRANFFTGFHWEDLGYSQFNNLPLIQSADIGGVYLLTFAIVLINSIFYEIIMSRRNFRRAAAVASCAVLVLSVVPHTAF